MSDWLSLQLDTILRDLAEKPAAPTSIARPSGVERETDITTEIVPIPKEYTPEAWFRYRVEARRGDPRNLLALYHEMPGRAAGPQIRRSSEAIESAEWEFAPMPLAARDETILTPEARIGREVAAYVADQLGPFMPDALRVFARREHTGFGAAAFRVEAGSGPGGLERAVSFEEIPGYRFRLDPKTFEFSFFQKARGGTAVPVAPFVETGSLLLFEDGGGVYPLDQRGLLWQIGTAWCVYQFGLRWWARLNERYALPYLDVGYAANLKDGAAEAEKVAAKLGSSGALIRPMEGIEAKFLSVMSAAQPDSLERAQEFCLRAFAACLLGHEQALGAREGAGAKTSDVAAQGVAEWLVAQQLRRAAVDFAAKWVRPMVVRNYGEVVAAVNTPVPTLHQTREIDREAEGRIANLIVSAGAEPPESELLKRVGYRQARPGERVLTRRQLAAPVAAAEPTSGGKLGENVVRFPMLGPGGKPPVLGADGAPTGIAEELLGPYRAIFADALNDGANPFQALTRVVQRARTRPDGKELADRLTSVLVASTGHGLEQARDDRSGR